MEKRVKEKRLYAPGSTEPFKLSRSKLALFLECPRCFYLDCRFGVSRPEMPGYALNVAVDTLLKREFDLYRKLGKNHPLFEEKGVKSILSRHPNLKKWRNNSVGIQFLHPATNFLVYGALDDAWDSEDRELEVVDFKATARKTPVIALDQPYHLRYKQQLELYQWLLRKNGERVSDTGYFLYCTGMTEMRRFSRRLVFDLNIIPHVGDHAWIEPALKGAHEALNSNIAPKIDPECRFCDYRIRSHLEIKKRI